MPLVTFIIPVRHQANAKDWPALKERLSQTMASIAGQSNPDWSAVIVANEGADLPDLPPQFSVARVTFPPNQLHDLDSADREQVYDAFRLDKGRRVLSGMLSARDARFFMIVDDDDFVSANIVSYVAKHPQANGWKIDKGYLWNEGGRLLMHYDDFANYCGTSLIIKSRLYDLPATLEAADVDYVKSMLGSHVRIGNILADRGTPLEALPFRGAIYRVGHSGAHSKSSSLLSTYFFNTSALRRPRQLLRNLRRVRPLDRGLRSEFFGAAGANNAKW
ncbi:galactosyl transferase [Rhizobium sp. BR 362]|uniref:galactosyl transferase n=1 Tax=Rhizobium sp. BR 362 TaxID=3040670 RepID=UPI002F418694